MFKTALMSAALLGMQANALEAFVADSAPDGVAQNVAELRDVTYDDHEVEL